MPGRTPTRYLPESPDPQLPSPISRAAHASRFPLRAPLGRQESGERSEDTPSIHPPHYRAIEIAIGIERASGACSQETVARKHWHPAPLSLRPAPRTLPEFRSFSVSERRPDHPSARSAWPPSPISRLPCRPRLPRSTWRHYPQPSALSPQPSALSPQRLPLCASPLPLAASRFALPAPAYPLPLCPHSGSTS
ncbi:MAG: hypothetical protein RI897_2601 [Verrucomicrobiota bacterium]